MGVVMAAVADGDGDANRSVVDRLCAAGMVLLSVQGAALSLIVDGELRGTAGVSDPVIAVVQELQLALGEGPCVDAWRDGAAVLEPDLADPSLVRWPAFAQEGVEAGVRAVFAFPLQIGAIGIGVLVLYRERPGGLSEEEIARGLVLADVAAQVILVLQAGAAADKLHELLANEPPHWAEVHQATGIVAVQLGSGLAEAFVRLRAHAFAEGRPLRLVARDIVGGRLRLDEFP
jgi:hypothetical protein